MYKYGMRLRPFGIGCQPMNGLVGVEDYSTAKGRSYWNILAYDRELTDRETTDYELDYIGEE